MDHNVVYELNNSSSVLTFYHQNLTDTTDRLNWHSDIELLFIVDGSGHLYSDCENIPLSAGDIAIVHPYSIHNVNPAVNSHIEQYAFLINNDFCVSNGISIDNISFQRIIKSAEMGKLLFELAEVQKQNNEFTQIKTRGLVLLIIAALAERFILAPPLTPPPISKSSSIRKKNIDKAIAYIQHNCSKKLSLQDISHHLNIDKSYLSRDFKLYTNKTVTFYINAMKCEHAKQLLQNTDNSISDISAMCGFDSMHYFSNVFKKYIRMSPSEYREYIAEQNKKS